MPDKLWSKGKPVDDWVIRFTVGEDYRWDTILLPFDIEATRAHAHGLQRAGILTGSEVESIDRALEILLKDYDRGGISVRPEDEDCHTVIERFLTHLLGDVGKKVHTGRSRNDQVLAALRLYLRLALAEAAKSTGALASGLIDLAGGKDDWVLPGYTHTRQAMPTSVAAWAMGFAELAAYDLEGLLHSRRRINVSPLGSAAGYGVPYLDLPRDEVAAELGFDGIQKHVASVQLSRGKLELEVVHSLAQVALTLNRLASDLILFSSAEFGFASIAPEHTTGSSIMPQKQNPDVLELVRASYHRVLAEMQLLSSLPAGLMSGYHRDLQLTKEAVMRAAVTTTDSLAATGLILGSVTFDRERIAKSIRDDTMATHRALKMTLEGRAFRDAYRSAAEGGEREESGEAAGPTPTAAEALAGYRVAGYPGHSDPAGLRNRIDESLREIRNP